MLLIHNKNQIAVIGEIIFDVFENSEINIGGAPLNFAINLAQQNIKNISIYSSIGNDNLGKEALKFCNSKIDASNIKVKSGETPKIIITKNSDENIFKIPKTSLFDDINFSIKNSIVYFGSLSMRNKKNLTKLKKLQGQNNFFLCDLNLREPFYNKNTIFELLNICNILKINHDEFIILLKILKKTDANDLIIYLTNKFNIELILVTNGKNGGFAYYKSKKISYNSKKINVVSTVGAGDSFFAGFISGLLKQKTVKESLKIGAEISSKVCNQNSSIIDK